MTQLVVDALYTDSAQHVQNIKRINRQDAVSHIAYQDLPQMLSLNQTDQTEDALSNLITYDPHSLMTTKY